MQGRRKCHLVPYAMLLDALIVSFSNSILLHYISFFFENILLLQWNKM